MKTHCYTILLLVLVWIHPGYGLLMCEDQKEVPIEDRGPEKYFDTPDDIRHYRHLYARGDYTRLKLIVRSEMTDYYSGEPVVLRFFVRNDSNKEIHIDTLMIPEDSAHLWKLIHSNDEEVAKTPRWEKDSQMYGHFLPSPRDFGGGPARIRFDYLKLQPGQEWELSGVLLNDYYDLTKPDTYELTCFQQTFIDNQYYETPMQSNTLTFRILERTGQQLPRLRTEPQKVPYMDRSPFEQILFDSDRAVIAKRDNLTPEQAAALPNPRIVPPKPEQVPFTNPPPGEEVFKQPQPPRNVFYVGVGNVLPPPGFNVSPLSVIDISPYSYYRQLEKEVAARAEAEQ